MSLTVRIKKKLSNDFVLDIEFETHNNICLGILGASGAGKSMILKCIAGIEKPDEGFISLDGTALFDSKKNINKQARERKVGYLFQNYALFPRMNALENIIAPLNGPKKEKLLRAFAWINALNLSGLEKQNARKLSGGEQQRVALARMLITEPQAVLLDEPFSALDSSLREYMQFTLLGLLQGSAKNARQNQEDNPVFHKGGKPPPLRSPRLRLRSSPLPPASDGREPYGGFPASLHETQRDAGNLFNNAILVTHSRDEVYRLCPELVILKKGKIMAQGETRTIFEKPPSLSCASLTGCKNISKITRTGDNEVFAVDWGITLRTKENIRDDISHIAIHAHHLVPLWNGEKKDCNEIQRGSYQKSLSPFEELIIFSPAGAEKRQEGRSIIWRKTQGSGGGEIPAIPERFFLPPELLLPLRQE
ncbi:MAG: ATP-binding cassette domain-containing protein [Spirochaetaceae bacterium]|nr:ATP-binding cassette domain-containing protein [Spirochaetaceae bacterium]